MRPATTTTSDRPLLQHVTFLLYRFVRSDCDGWRNRGIREVVEAPVGRTLPPEAEPGALRCGPNITDVVVQELFESEVVGRARTRQRLSKHAMLGLVAGGL